ncbi:MAG: OmpA family protein [Cytophagales bacterium]|nr:OmpA family protein [Cytophagales bacterium]
MRLKILISGALWLILTVSFAQNNYKTFLKKADRAYHARNYDDAVRLYKKAEKFKKGNAKITYKIGKSYLLSREKVKALPYLKTVQQLDPNIDRDIDLQLGKAYQYNYRFDEAIKAYTRYGQKNPKMVLRANRKIAECRMADSLYANPNNAKVTGLGNTINSRWNDYTPLITADGNTMVFTSNRAGSTGGLKLRDGTYYEDIYISQKENGLWTKPVNISSKINFKFHDAASSLSPDGNTLFLYYESGGGDIYVSYFTNGEWSSPVSISDEINSAFWETSISITRDGKTLYFTSDRPGGYGNLDIYKSELKEDGSWGRPRNLGPSINTSGNEDSPFIMPNGDVLYFSSDGHLGMGEHDVFYSEMVDGKFQPPVNMGYPINTVHSDNYFVISEDKKQAYYASIRENGIGMADIYSIDLSAPPPVRKKVPKKTKPVETPAETPTTVVASAAPLPPIKEEPPTDETPATASKEYYDEYVTLQKDLGIITLLKGKVIDAETGKPLEAQIRLTDNVGNKEMALVNSNAETGEFELIIPNGGNYGVSTVKTGYLFNSINFNLPAFSDYQEVDTHIILQKAEIGSKIVLKNIFFDIGKSDLRTESLGELARIRELLEGGSDLKVQINGHTDNVGNAVYNKVLSKKRAQSVVDYLVQHGIAQERLAAKGFGEERPLVSNDDEVDGREINRRTEIEIIGVGNDI